MTKRTLGMAGLFLMGCAVGGGASAFVVPKASAQQAATLPQWEMTCWGLDGVMDPSEAARNVMNTGNRLGAQRWEPVGALGAVFCWKRPR